MLKNKCCLYVIISIRFFSIMICNLLIEFPLYKIIFETIFAFLRSDWSGLYSALILGNRSFIPVFKYLLVLCAGCDVVDWLHAHVEGFLDRRDARKYASQMLKAGYIRHTVNKITFSEQCYYVFGDLCAGEYVCSQY